MSCRPFLSSYNWVNQLGRKRREKRVLTFSSQYQSCQMQFVSCCNYRLNCWTLLRKRPVQNTISLMFLMGNYPCRSMTSWSVGAQRGLPSLLASFLLLLQQFNFPRDVFATLWSQPAKQECISMQTERHFTSRISRSSRLGRRTARGARYKQQSCRVIRNMFAQP